jgi:hypothetical protein
MITMVHSCDWTDPISCAKAILGGAASTAANTGVSAAWDAVCKSFADAAAQLLGAFGRGFAALPDLNIASAGITSTYGISLVIAGTVAALLVMGQAARTAWTHDGSGLAQALAGTAKAVLAWLLTAAVATTALAAADEVTRFVVNTSFGSQQALANRLAGIVNWAEVAGVPGQAAVGGSLLLVFALVGIILVVVLWFEMLLRNAALAVLIAVSPIAAAGQVSEVTKAWWLRTASASVQLIILKPVVALVFAVGFGMAGQSIGVQSLLAGLLVLALAAFAWPVIARFFTFATVQASGSGLAAVLGFAAGAAAGRAGSGSPAGVDPAQWSMATEGRTMAARGSAGVSAGGPGSAAQGELPAGAGAAGAMGAGGATGSGGGGGGGGAGSAVAAGAGWALQKAQQAGGMLAARMEQTAAHAGMPGSYPYSTMNGGRIGPGIQAQRGAGAAPSPERQTGQHGQAYEASQPESLDSAGYGEPETEPVPPYAAEPYEPPISDDLTDEEEPW